MVVTVTSAEVVHGIADVEVCGRSESVAISKVVVGLSDGPPFEFGCSPRVNTPWRRAVVAANAARYVAERLAA